MTQEELAALFRNYLESMRQPMDMSLTQGDLPIRFMPSTNEDNVFGSQDYLNDNLTMEKKVNDVLADPSFISRLGSGTGGFRPEDFQSKVTYQPVKAPGYQRLAMYENSGDAVQTIMADVFKNKGTAKQAYSAVLSAMGNPDHPLNQQLLADEAIYFMDNNQKRVPDKSYLEKLANSIEKDVINDPQFYAFDPTTGLPANPVDENGNVLGGSQAFDTSGAGFTDGEMTSGANGGGQYVQGQDGNWYLRQETPTSTMEWFTEQGLNNPYDTYNPDDLATSGQLAHRDDALARYLLAQDKYDTETGKLPTAEGLRNQEELRIRGEEATASLGARGLLGGPSAPARDTSLDHTTTPEMSQADRTALLVKYMQGDDSGPLGGKVADIRPASGQMYIDNARGRTDQNRKEQNSKRVNNAVKTGLQQASMARYLADIERGREQSGAYWANQGDRKRQLQAQRLHAQGFSPFADQMRAREANVYGY